MRRLKAECGSALVIAMLSMLVMMGLGTAVLSYVDNEQLASSRSRISDSAFNLAEGVMETQVYLLTRNWPGSVATARPAACTQSSATAGCPTSAQILTNFSGGDWPAGSSWTTQVRDNGGAANSFYSDAVTGAQPTWDANGDGRVWVRAQGVVRGRTRIIVALVQVQGVDSSLVFAHNVITAGWLQTTNNGRKVIIDTKGDAAQASPVSVRCTERVQSCLGYEVDKGQIAPDTTQTGYSGGDALPPDRLETLRTRAIAAGTYFSGCPVNPSGRIVFIQSGDCRYDNSAGPCCNSTAAPGVLVIERGTLQMLGNIVYHGIVYLVNKQQSSGVLLSLGGTVDIAGAVAVDGPGGVYAGSSGVNVSFASGVFNSVVGYGTAGIIQNTWRELGI
jgi:hypothetical protein